jgi:hypothetical protein
MMKTLKEAATAIQDKEELSYFYSDGLFCFEDFFSWQETLDFYNETFKDVKIEDASSVYIVMAKKAMAAKESKDVETFLMKAEKAIKLLENSLKEASPEDFRYDLDNYLYHKASLFLLYLKMGKDKQVDFTGEDPLLKVYFESEKGGDLLWEGEFGGYEKSIDKSLRSLNHLSVDKLPAALLNIWHFRI